MVVLLASAAFQLFLVKYLKVGLLKPEDATDTDEEAKYILDE